MEGEQNAFVEPDGWTAIDGVDNVNNTTGATSDEKAMAAQGFETLIVDIVATSEGTTDDLICEIHGARVTGGNFALISGQSTTLPKAVGATRYRVTARDLFWPFIKVHLKSAGASDKFDAVTAVVHRAKITSRRPTQG
jgi:hypothetical protein